MKCGEKKNRIDSYLHSVIIFSAHINARVKFIAGFIAKEIGVTTVSFTNHPPDFFNYKGPKINYSNQQMIEDEYWIKPHSLLFENTISPQKIECFDAGGYKAFFKTEGDFKFDIFAASFYLLSRYEEYLPHTKDMYGRFAHDNSLACKEGFLSVPLINIWIVEFKKTLKNKFPDLAFFNQNFQFLPTYDIDEAFAYKYKSWKRIIGASIKNLWNRNFEQFRERRKVLAGKLPDPYDAYKWMDELHGSYQLNPIYFFLVPGKTGKYDKPILPGTEAMQGLIKQQAEKYRIGIHPSWQSGDDPKLSKKEIETLENISGKRIAFSRQHYIRFTLPETYRYLLNAGIKEDFSMGYGSINGFRASVASSFYWYDLEKEQATELLINPFCFMEANSFYEQKFTAQQALEEMRHYYKEIKKISGTFITIWHNSFLGTAGKFSGWREMYAQFIKEMVD